jgi:hypothetical protein
MLYTKRFHVPNPTFYVINSTFRIRYLPLLYFPSDAEGNPPHYAVSTQAPHALLLSKQTTPPNRCTLGNVEAQACTDARSDHAVLDFFVSFFIKKKRKNKNLL